MSTFGEMEADWRDHQSGARDQQYDEEQLGYCDDEESAGTEGGVIADARNPFLRKPPKREENAFLIQSTEGGPEQTSGDERAASARLSTAC